VRLLSPFERSDLRQAIQDASDAEAHHERVKGMRGRVVSVSLCYCTVRPNLKIALAARYPAMAYRVRHPENSERRGGLEPAQKQSLASLVSYQAGSVVSRTIINRRAGTMTLFAFDEGEGLSEHTAPYDALLHVLEGEAKVTVSGKESHVNEGEAIVLPAGKPHAVRAAKRFKMLLTMIRA